MRPWLLLSASTLFLGVAPAFAQDTSTPTASGAPLGDIVVTAQRRSQNIQDVPISITALNPHALQDAGVRDPRDLALLVPNLSFQSAFSASSAAIFIRGVGISDLNSNSTGAVGVYVDDVFIGANAGKLANVFDLAGVEVLKGPQGTLYGRNTTGGAVRFSSRKPTDTWTGDGSLLYGHLNEVRLEAGVGGPIVQDLVKVRVAGLYNRRDGYDYNRVTGHYLNNIDLWAGRAIVDITPTDTLLIRGTVHGGNNTSGARQFQHRGQGITFTGSPNVSPSGVPLDGFGYADTDGNIDAGAYDVEGKEKVATFGASLDVEWKLDGITLTSISAYEQVNRHTLEDTDASPNNVLPWTGIR